MKTGIILYILGNQSINDSDDAVTKEAKQLIPDADRIELVSKDCGHWDVSDAWRTLIAKGMHKIIVKLAEHSKSEGLQLIGNEMRLSG